MISHRMEKDASSSSSSSRSAAAAAAATGGGGASLLPHNNAIPNPNSSVMSIQLNHLSAASFLQDNELFVTHFFSAAPPQQPPQQHHHLISSMAPLINTEEAAHHHHLITSPLDQKKKMNKVTRKAAAGHGDGCVAPRKARGPGKKDRHSKICTAKGPRDRRMRLSLQIAHKFFDLQDMLGFDKASKTIDWLFSKSKSAIKDLIITTTTKTPHHQQEEEEGKASIEADDDPSAVYPNPSKIVQQGKESKGKSTKTSAAAACLPGPDLARESRERARARARERTKEKMMLKRSLDEKKFRNPNDTGCQISGSGMSSFTSEESSSNNKTEEEAALLPREPEATAAAAASIIAETAINKNASSSQGFMPETAINPAMSSFSAGTPPTISINSSGDHLIMDADVLSNFCFLSQLLENHHHL